MQIFKKAVVLGMLAVMSSACMYGAVATVGDNRVVITRNDMFMSGMLRKAFVCNVTDAGLEDCQTNQNP